MASALTCEIDDCGLPGAGRCEHCKRVFCISHQGTLTEQTSPGAAGSNGVVPPSYSHRAHPRRCSTDCDRLARIQESNRRATATWTFRSKASAGDERPDRHITLHENGDKKVVRLSAAEAELFDELSEEDRLAFLKMRGADPQ